MGAQGPDFWAIITLLFIAGVVVWRWRFQQVGPQHPPDSTPPARPPTIPAISVATAPAIDDQFVPVSNDTIARLAAGGLAPLAIAEQLRITLGEVELALHCAGQASPASDTEAGGHGRRSRKRGVSSTGAG